MNIPWATYQYITFLILCAVVYTMRRILVSAHVALLMRFELQCMTVKSCVTLSLDRVRK